MIVVNFSHPLTAAQCRRIEEIAGQAISRVVASPARFDQAMPFGPQAVALVDGVGLDADAWQSEPLLVVPPAFSPIGCAVLAELHGRCGYFPPIVRLAAQEGAMPPVFDVAEIVDLNRQRLEARGRRSPGSAA